MSTNIRKIAKHGPNAGWQTLRDILRDGAPFTNSSGSWRGSPTDSGFTGRLEGEALANFRAAGPHIDYVVRSYATPIAWRYTTPEGDVFWTVPDDSYSSTTSAHQGVTRTAIAQL